MDKDFTHSQGNRAELVPESLRLFEIVKAEVYRGRSDGYSDMPDESLCVGDLVVDTGRIFLAKRIGSNVGSAMAYMAVGTGSTAAALTDGSTPGLYGEVLRKALSTNTADTNNVYSAVSTFGGASDSLTGLVLQEAGLFNHASSGQGTCFQRVTYSSVTLQASDLLKITLQTNVGSNTI